ncbi:MAG: T9SS type A sorting domain-containing protein [Bacteroidota bacterium]|nr:T9SS type A sorting domain-containing protein [Bacteroidota bacterium]
MKNFVHKIIVITSLSILSISFQLSAQTCEWQLANPTFNPADPDGPGPATGSVTFTLQVWSTGSDIPNVTGISTGWSWQSANAMLPTGSPCGSNSVSQPANITMSSAFSGFTYNNVDECSGSVNFTTYGQTFDRRSSGTVDGGPITITSTPTDVFTVTLWTLGSTPPEGGYVVINSSDIGSPAPFGSYALSDISANEYAVNSLTYTTALPLSSTALPARFSNFDASCTNNGTLVSWTTASESNSDYFELQHSTDGNNWASVATIKALGNSSAKHTYQQVDEAGGALLYRIKEVDLDGHFIYTSIIRTNCESKKLSIVTYPVPAGNLLNVVITSDKSLKTQLLIINSTGEIVRKTQATLFNGSNTFQFNLNGLSTGNYIIRSTDSSVEFNKKFTIVR